MTSTAMSGYSNCSQVLFGTQADSNNRVQWCPNPPCYDAAGNMLHDMQHAYTYDGENRVLQVDAGSTATDAYNALGQRDQKTGTNNVNYVYGVGGEVLAEYSSTGSLLNEYIYFVGQRIARRDGSGNVYYYYSDALGSTRIITDASKGSADLLSKVRGYRLRTFMCCWQTAGRLNLLHVAIAPPLSLRPVLLRDRGPAEIKTPASGPGF